MCGSTGWCPGWVLPTSARQLGAALFHPDSVPITNLLEVNNLLELMLRLMVVFGLGILMPVIVVTLNSVGA